MLAATREEEVLRITVGNRVQNQVSQFEYLGSLINSTCDPTTEIRARQGGARLAIYIPSGKKVHGPHAPKIFQIEF